MSDVERRIEALEKANRLWRYGAGLLASLLLIALTVAAKLPDEVPEVVQAKRIEVLAPDGRAAIVLSADADGSLLRLSAAGQNHDQAIALGADDEAVHLALMKHKEAPLLIARVDDAGSSLSLFDGRAPSQSPRAIVLRSAWADKQHQGGTTITLMKGWRKDGVQAGLFMQDAPDGSFLFLGGPQGKSVRVRVNQDNAKVDFIGENNKAIWTTP